MSPRILSEDFQGSRLLPKPFSPNFIARYSIGTNSVVATFSLAHHRRQAAAADFSDRGFEIALKLHTTVVGHSQRGWAPPDRQAGLTVYLPASLPNCPTLPCFFALHPKTFMTQKSMEFLHVMQWANIHIHICTVGKMPTF